MMDPPRHACRGRPIVCPGPCNPLKAHHHHHHHRHHRQRPDVTGVAAPKDIPLPDEFSQIALLRSFKTDASVASATSMDDTSISATSSATKIALIRIQKTPRFKETDIPAIVREILSRGRLEMLGEPSKPRSEKTDESAPLKKIESPIPTGTIPQPTETPARTVAYPASRNLKDVTCAFMKRLNGLTPKRASPFFLCLTILVIYAGIHILLAVITWQTPAYQFFVSSQICGVLAFLMWRLTGTILI